MSDVSLNCAACFNDLADPADPAPAHCPYCRANVSGHEQTPELRELGPYRIWKRLDRFTPQHATVRPREVYLADRDGLAVRLSILSENDHSYRTERLRRDGPPEGIDEEHARFYAKQEDGSELVHPHILRTFAPEWDGDVCFLAVEHVDGRSLPEWIEENGPLSVPDAVTITIACARVLAYAESTGTNFPPLGQSGLMPRGILLSKNSDVKITIFSKLYQQFVPFEKAIGYPKVNRSGLFRQYFPPEQLKELRELSESALELTDGDRLARLSQIGGPNRPRQIYCLGAMLFELLTRVPASRLWTDDEVTEGMREMNPNVPQPLEDAVHRMMAEEPEDRFRQFEEVISTLEDMNLHTDALDCVQGRLAVDPVRQAHNERFAFPETSSGADFRGVKWGMTQAEVIATEATDPNFAFPAFAAFTTVVGGVTFQLAYIFGGEEGQPVCCRATLIPPPGLHNMWYMEPAQPGEGYLLSDFSPDPQELPEDTRKILEQGQARRDEVVARHREERRKQIEQLEATGGSQHLIDALRESDRRRDELAGKEPEIWLRPSFDDANRDYDVLKKFLHERYGDPTVDDRPLTEAEVQECAGRTQLTPEQRASVRVSAWDTPATRICLSLTPMLCGLALTAEFNSKEYQHLYSD